MSLSTIFRRQTMIYNTYLFETIESAMCAGREIRGTPKVLADVSLVRNERTVVGRTIFQGTEITRSIFENGQECTMADGPSYSDLRLKLISRAD